MSIIIDKEKSVKKENEHMQKKYFIKKIAVTICVVSSLICAIPFGNIRMVVSAADVADPGISKPGYTFILQQSCKRKSIS